MGPQRVADDAQKAEVASWRSRSNETAFSEDQHLWSHKLRWEAMIRLGSGHILAHITQTHPDRYAAGPNIGQAFYILQSNGRLDSYSALKVKRPSCKREKERERERERERVFNWRKPSGKLHVVLRIVFMCTRSSNAPNLLIRMFADLFARLFCLLSGV